MGAEQQSRPIPPDNPKNVFLRSYFGPRGIRILSSAQQEEIRRFESEMRLAFYMLDIEDRLDIVKGFTQAVANPPQEWPEQRIAALNVALQIMPSLEDFNSHLGIKVEKGKKKGRPPKKSPSFALREFEKNRRITDIVKSDMNETAKVKALYGEGLSVIEIGDQLRFQRTLIYGILKALRDSGAIPSVAQEKEQREIEEEKVVMGWRLQGHTISDIAVRLGKNTSQIAKIMDRANRRDEAKRAKETEESKESV